MAPELVVLGIMFASLGFYAVLGGADFGAGVWEFTTSLDADAKDRKLIANAIGPVWEANHVWLIFVLIIMFNGFPLAFAAISRALWFPLLFALAGIVFRGAGFVIRGYARGADWLRHLAGAAFSLASTCTPFFLGMSIGALSSGLPINADGTYAGNQLVDWLTPLSLYAGILAVGMCAYLASVFLARESYQQDDATLENRWRGRALATGIWVGILSWLGLIMCKLDAPLLWDGLLAKGWPLIGTSLGAGIGSLLSLRGRRYRLANLLSATAVVTVLLGWALGTYPRLVPPEITIQSAKAPNVVLWAMVVCISIGSLILFPALWWLLSIFKGDRQSTLQK